MDKADRILTAWLLVAFSGALATLAVSAWAGVDPLALGLARTAEELSRHFPKHPERFGLSLAADSAFVLAYAAVFWLLGLRQMRLGPLGVTTAALGVLAGALDLLENLHLLGLGAGTAVYSLQLPFVAWWKFCCAALALASAAPYLRGWPALGSAMGWAACASAGLGAAGCAAFLLKGSGLALGALRSSLLVALLLAALLLVALVTYRPGARARLHTV